MTTGGGLSSWELGLCGAAGALLWLLLVYGFPLAWQATGQDFRWRPSAQNVVGVTAVVALSLLFGGVAPLVFEADASKDAVVAGLGWQGLFGQYAKPMTSAG